MGKEVAARRTDPEGPIRLGLLGGTFDPIHIGHLRLAIEAIERFELDRVQLVLSSVPPHKETNLVTTWGKRWRMLELACADNDKLMPSSVEIDRPGPSYTVDTLRQIRSGLAERDELYLIVGTDAAAEMKTWKSYRSIPDLARVVVAARAGERLSTFGTELRDSIEYFDFPALEVSSTGIRNSVREGKDISHLVPPAVHRYIRDEGLYREGSPHLPSSRGSKSAGEKLE